MSIFLNKFVHGENCLIQLTEILVEDERSRILVKTRFLILEFYCIKTLVDSTPSKIPDRSFTIKIPVNSIKYFSSCM